MRGRAQGSKSTEVNPSSVDNRLRERDENTQTRESQSMDVM